MLYTLCVSWFRNTHSHLGSHWNALQTCAGWDATFSFPFSTCCRNTQAVVSHLGPDTQKNISSCGVSGYHPPAFFFIHPHPSFLYQLPRAGLRGESFWGRVRNCINYSCLVLWPQGQRCQSRLGPQQWCIAAIKKKEEKGKPLLLAASVQLLLVCTNNSVTSAHGRTGSDSFIQLHHVPAWLQANPG